MFKRGTIQYHQNTTTIMNIAKTYYISGHIYVYTYACKMQCVGFVHK